MTIRSESRLERLLHQGVFCVTSEVVPPTSGDPRAVTLQARGLVGYADAVNVTDNPASSAHMSSSAGAALVAAAGVEPVLQLTVRDRNRLGLTADLLGSWALGARNILCLSGDPPVIGDHPQAKQVFDLSVVELIGLAASLRAEGRLLSGAVIESPPRFFIGVADQPLVSAWLPRKETAEGPSPGDVPQDVFHCRQVLDGRSLHEATHVPHRVGEVL